METSRKAVEVYRRTRLIDQVSMDDDHIAPVYRLDEICDTFRISSFDLVREVLQYTMKRLGHKSPRVKQKILRVIKYTAGKCGPEYKRELQRQAGIIRQLFNYKGQPDPLRGDALNKAVRDTAHETLNAIFASDDKPPTSVDASKRIQGFGSSNFDFKVPEKKSLLDEVVGFGTASFKQGLNLISSYSSNSNGGSQNDLGSYKGPTLRRSLTSEQEISEQHFNSDFENLRDSSRLMNQRPEVSPDELEVAKNELNDRGPGMRIEREFSREDKLLETITAPGGVRLQPTRESLQSFLVNALRLDPVNLGRALEAKLQVHSWQVRLKALCALEAILRQKDQQFYLTIAMMFEKDADAIHDCAQSPQSSLREKAKKGQVLDLLGSSQIEELSTEKPAPKTAAPLVMEMPDLLDTKDSIFLEDADIQPNVLPSKTDIIRADTQAFTQERDFFADTLSTDCLHVVHGSTVNDPFSEVSFHAPEGTVQDAPEDLFSGLSIGGDNLDGNGSIYDGASVDGLNTSKSDEDVAFKTSDFSESLFDLIGSSSINNTTLESGSSGTIPSLSKASLPEMPEHGNPLSAKTLGSMQNPQTMYLNPPFMLPMGLVPNFQSNLLPQSFSPAPMGLGSMAEYLSQQQLMTGIPSFQTFGMGRDLGNGGGLHGGMTPNGGLTTAFPDDFFSSDATSRYKEVADSIKKEDTKAFDFISEHVSAVRGFKRTT